jgi:hypothetical protein
VLGARPVPVSRIGEEAIVTARSRVRVPFAIALHVGPGMLVVPLVMARLLFVSRLIALLVLILLSMYRGAQAAQRERQHAHGESVSVFRKHSGLSSLQAWNCSRPVAAGVPWPS